MPPIVHCVRHGEGWHNLSEENMNTVHDPSLTAHGREQAFSLSNIRSLDCIEYIAASPLRRTIQTALLGFTPIMKEKGLKLVLLPKVQETSSKEADTGSPLWQLKREFGDRLDGSRIVDKGHQGKWQSNKDEWEMTSANVKEHALEIRQWLKELPYSNILLVTHGGFLHYLEDDWSEAPDGEGSTGWENTEYRAFEFVDEKSAKLVETEESKQKRKGKPQGGMEAKNLTSRDNE